MDRTHERQVGPAWFLHHRIGRGRGGRPSGVAWTSRPVQPTDYLLAAVSTRFSRRRKDRASRSNACVRGWRSGDHGERRCPAQAPSSTSIVPAVRGRDSRFAGGANGGKAPVLADRVHVPARGTIVIPARTMKLIHPAIGAGLFRPRWDGAAVLRCADCESLDRTLRGFEIKILI
jgi:hypothetical protein